MRKLAILSLIMLAGLVLAGCGGQPVPSAANAPAVTGKVTYTEDVTLPDKAMARCSPVRVPKGCLLRP